MRTWTERSRLQARKNRRIGEGNEYVSIETVKGKFVNVIVPRRLVSKFEQLFKTQYPHTSRTLYPRLWLVDSLTKIKLDRKTIKYKNPASMNVSAWWRNYVQYKEVAEHCAAMYKEAQRYASINSSEMQQIVLHRILGIEGRKERCRRYVVASA